MDPLNILAKFEIRSFSRSSDTRGYPKNLSSPWICPRFLFCTIFHGLLFGWTLLLCLPNLKFVALPIPEIIAIGVSGGVGTQSWGRGGRRRSGMVPFERAKVSSYRPPIATFSVSLRVSEILPLLCSRRPFFPTHL